MSVDIGPSASIVYHQQLERGGQSPEALQTTIGEIMEIAPEFTEMISALEFIIENPQDSGERMRGAGRYLFGVRSDGFNVEDQENKPFDGLLYAEAEQMLESGAFSVVRMGTWIRQDRQSFYDSDEELEGFLNRVALSEVEAPDDDAWGVPVNRDTTIIKFHPKPGEPSEGYTYGHMEDFQAVTDLEVPDDLKKQIGDAVARYHSKEAEN